MIDLDAIKARLAAATPGPWTFEDGDDDDFCSAVAICAPIPASERQQTNFAGDFNARAVVALTLWQNPRIAVIHDARWDENAWLIANAPTDIAALVAEVERLRAALDGPPICACGGTFDEHHIAESEDGAACYLYTCQNEKCGWQIGNNGEITERLTLRTNPQTERLIARIFGLADR